MPKLLDRAAIKDSFAPLVPLVEEIVASARSDVELENVIKAFPAIGRLAGYRRVRGYARWLIIAEALVARSDEMPSGFGRHSSDADHNQGRYAFQWPMGLLTVRREPHEGDDEGKWFQQRIEGIAEQAALAPGVDAFAGIKAYVSVPAEGTVKFVFAHPTLEKPITIALDEFDADGVMSFRPSAQQPRTSVSSTRKDAVEVARTDEPDADG